MRQNEVEHGKRSKNDWRTDKWWGCTGNECSDSCSSSYRNSKWCKSKRNSERLCRTAGRGYYQEWGKEAVELNPGDVINIPAGVKHWHGAAPDSWFSHLAVEVPGEETANEWCEAVSDEEYGKLK